VIALEAEFCAVFLLFTEPVIAVNRGLGMRSLDPVRSRTPFEYGSFRCFGKRLTGSKQCFDIDAVVGDGFLYRHLIAPVEVDEHSRSVTGQEQSWAPGVGINVKACVEFSILPWTLCLKQPSSPTRTPDILTGPQ
jgi:hypothetical protein